VEVAGWRRVGRIRHVALQEDLAAAQGSGFGTAASSASVYGCLGVVNRRSVGADSTTWPTYITTTR